MSPIRRIAQVAFIMAGVVAARVVIHDWRGWLTLDTAVLLAVVSVGIAAAFAASLQFRGNPAFCLDLSGVIALFVLGWFQTHPPWYIAAYDRGFLWSIHHSDDLTARVYGVFLIATAVLSIGAFLAWFLSPPSRKVSQREHRGRAARRSL
jgi:hypothetical protein